MMMEIFSIFDPYNSMNFSINWYFIIIPFYFMPFNFWIINSRWINLLMTMFKFLNNEFKMILKKKIYKINFISIFFYIFLINFLGLFPYIFTQTSHMSFNLSLALPMWMNFMLLGWLFNTNKMLIHQVPMSTPPVLMPFMVMIEFISNIIRPITLSIRLTANMIAGHLLLTLISNNGNKLSLILATILIIIQSLLMILELSVSLIQSYVFSILLSLYSQEI